MKSSALGRLALSLSAAVALLTGCGGLQPPIGAPGVIPHSNAVAPPSYRVLYSFGDLPDGNTPKAGVMGKGGTFYGTTAYGGAYPSSSGLGSGTVFSVTTGGAEKVLHGFGSTDDGSFPSAALIDVSGTLYGTTFNGGLHRCSSGYVKCGTVFSITTAGTEKVLHSFAAGSRDGSSPVARLLNVKGTLYGTTESGGKYCEPHDFGCGTVFSITTGGTERVLHSFGNGADGAFPEAGLVEANGMLYGTTSAGGTYGAGTVFSITLGGAEKVLHSFAPYPHRNDGSYPLGSLAVLGGVLYGTTVGGGKYRDGTVFSITTSGAEKVLCSFRGLTDGAAPMAGLAVVAGTLYGTTSAGGADRGGTIFSITTAGTEKVVHSFGKGTDGSTPMAGMNYTDGRLLGTTSSGGVHRKGTVFSLTP